MERRLSAILSYDVVEYSLALGRNEAATLGAMARHRREVIEPLAASRGGRTIKHMGDGALLEFASAVDAVTFAVAMQQAIGASALPEEQRLAYRVGVTIGDVVHEGGDVYGEGVNLAVRLESLAEPGGICLHESVRDQLRGRLDLDFAELGEVEVKNIDHPVRALRLVMNERAAAVATLPAERPVRRRHAVPFWLIAAIAAVLIAPALGLWRPWAPEFEPVAPEAMAHPLPDRPSVAVLALDDLSTGPDAGYLSDAIAEGVITKLSRYSELFVIARNSSFSYRGGATDVRDVAAELGVQYLVEGSQQKSGDKLRVTIQLIDALAGNHIWAETYDRELADLFTVQDEIAQAIAAAVSGRVLADAGERAGRVDAARLSALQLALQARIAMRKQTREGTEEALRLGLAAVEADPTSHFGYQVLAFVYGRLHDWKWSDLEPDEALARARKAAETALALAPDDSDAHYAMGYVHKTAGESEQALARFRQAIELNPSATVVMAQLGEMLAYAGRFDEAIEELEHAMRLDPHHPDWFKWTLGWAQWHAGQCAAALATLLGMANMPGLANRDLATVYICLGRQEDAERAIARLIEAEPGYTTSDLRRYMAPRYDNPADLEHWVDALRAAGLPE